MDLYTVNKTTYKAEKVVEGWDSLIWTERYTDCGDFELRTPLVEKIMGLLPVDSLCCILQSNELMWVETHDISVDEDGNDVLVVRGRSFESFFEKRVIFGGHKEEWKTPINYNLYGGPAILLWNYLQQTSGWDRLRPTSYGLSTRDAIPNIAVAHASMGSGTQTYQSIFTAVEWWLKSGEFYPQFRDWLIRGGMGVRTRRPGSSPTTGFLLNPDSTGQWGSVSPVVNDSRLILEIYNGWNKTKVPEGAKSVIFSDAQGHIESSTYLDSGKDHYTMAHVATSIGSVDVYSPDNADGLANGFARKVMYIDGGDVGDQDPTAFIASMVQKGEIELAKHRRSFVFDGEFSTEPYVYGAPGGFSLGDVVTVIGKYGFTANMLVSEYVRAEDQEGERGFPTLSLF